MLSKTGLLFLLFILTASSHAQDLNVQADQAANQYQTGQYDLAIQACEKMLQVRPHFARAFLIEVKCYHAQGKDSQALAEAQKGLGYHPDNALLRHMVELLKASPTPVPTKTESEDKDSATPTPVAHSVADTKVWIKFGAAPAFGALSDFQNAAAEWRSFFTNSDHVNDDNFGLLASAEFGWMLDQSNGLAVNFTGGAYSSLVVDGQAVTTISSASVTYHYQQNSSPTFADTELVYYHFWNQKDGRFYIKLGAGYGLANVNFFAQSVYTGAYIDNGLTNGPADLSALNITFSGGIGYEWRLSDGLGLDLCITGRYASFSNLTGTMTTTDYQGNTTNNGQVGFYKGTKGRFEVDYAGNVPSSATPVTVDFSGLDLALAINAYFF